MTIGAGRVLSHYRIVDEISRGGMGVVYRAVDVHLNREVALKVLPADLVRDPDRRQRFVQEAQAASSLEHPHIAVVHDVGEDDGVSFIAMELVRGEKLSSALAGGTLGAARALDLATEVAEALAHAHDRGIIHRDLKPANVMFTDEGHAKVIDFGLAKLVAPLAGDRDTTMVGDTGPGIVLGTVAYMSPEQARGGRVDQRTDIFSFGILLHEMLAGAPPFRGGSDVETLHGILTEAPPPLPPLGPGVALESATEIQRIRDKCLAKGPEDRYQGMKDLVVDLRAARRRLESGSASVVAPRTARVPRRLSPIAALVVVAVAGAAAWMWRVPAETPTGSKPSVAVLYFENNTGTPDLNWLRTGLTDMLVTDLSQSQQIEVLSTDRLHQILSELNRAEDRSVSFDVVQEIARRAGVKTVLVGSYMKAGDAIRINVKMQEAASGRILGSERAEALGEPALFTTIDDLTRRVKAKLQLPTGAPPTPGLFTNPVTVSTSSEGADRDLREVTTSSIDAYRYYAEGIHLHERFREAEALPLFEKALAVDPTFALAMAKLAVVHSNLGNSAESNEYIRRAFEHAHRVTTRERVYIEGFYYDRRQDTMPQAIDTYERGLKLYPDHASLRNNLALLYLQLERADEATSHYEELRRRGMSFPASYGALSSLYAWRGELARAEEVLRDYIGRYPDNPIPHAALAQLHVSAGRLDDGLAGFARAEAFDADNLGAHTGRWNVFILRGQYPEAAAHAQKITKSDAAFRRWRGYMELALGALYSGRSKEALAAFERAIRAYTKPGQSTARARVQSAHLHLAKGDAAAALGEAQKAFSEAAGQAPESAAQHALALAQAALGRGADAAATLEAIRRRAEQLQSPREQRRFHHLSGQLALQRGDSKAAVQALTEAEKRIARKFLVLAPQASGDTLAPIWFDAASAHFANGDLGQAERRFRQIVDGGTFRVHWPIEYARSLYFLGAIHEKRGEMTQAAAAYRRFYDLWRTGDLDRDRIAEVERKLRTLTTE